MNQNKITQLLGIKYPIIPAAGILKEFIESYNKTLNSLTKMYAFK